MADDNNPIPEVSYTPVATPPQIQVRPPALQQDDSYNQLIAGLSKLDSGLASFVSDAQTNDKENDKLLGEQAAFRANAGGQIDGVQQGAIPAWHSPAFKEGYGQTQGNLIGDDLQSRYNQAFQAWDGKGSGDPQDFKDFYQDFIQDNVNGSSDPNVLRGLMPKLTQLTNTAQSQWSTYNDNLAKTKAYAQGSATINNTIDQHQSAVLGAAASGGQNAPPTAEDLWNNIQKAAQAPQVQALSPADQQSMIISTIEAKAAQIKGADGKAVLDLLNKPVPGLEGGVTYRDLPEGQKAYQNAMTVIEQDAARQIQFSQKQDADAQSQRKTAQMSAAYSTMLADPSHNIPAAVWNDPQAAKDYGGAGEWQKTLLAGRKTLVDDTGVTDPETLLNLNRQIMAGGGVAAVNDAMNKGLIHNAKDYKEALDFASKQAGTKDVMAEIKATGGMYDNYMKSIKTNTQTDKIADPLGTNGFTQAGLAANATMEMQVIQWAQAHPQDAADPLKRIQAVKAIGDAVLGGISGGEGQVKTYTPPANTIGAPVATPNPAGAPALGPSPVAAPPAPATAPAPANPAPASASAPRPNASTVPVPLPPSGVMPQPAATAPTPAGDPTMRQSNAWFGTQSSTNQQALINAAKAQGTDPQAFVTSVYQKAVAAGKANPKDYIGNASGAPDYVPILDKNDAAQQQIGQLIDQNVDAKNQRTDPNQLALLSQQFQRAATVGFTGSSPTQGGYTLAALKSDPTAAHILDFVAGAENGAHGGNYNSYYGHADSNIDLSKMSLGQIATFMKDRGTASSATGRYQFMAATLFGNKQGPGLMQRMGLTSDTKFTPELQDQMAVQLMKDAGYDQWKSGNLPTGQFANKLAGIWASLPMPSGLSRYQSDGVNHALVSRPALEGALQTAQSLPNTPGVVGKPGTFDPATGASLMPGAPVRPPAGPNNIYGNVPDVDGRGKPGQVNKFLAWNPDPVGNQSKNLASLDPGLSAVVQKAQADNPDLHFVVASGKRDQAQENTAVANGWAPSAYAQGGSLANYSKGFAKQESKHITGKAVDLWPLDSQGRVHFDGPTQARIAGAMKKAASSLGTDMRWGGNFSHPDLPHFEVD